MLARTDARTHARAHVHTLYFGGLSGSDLTGLRKGLRIHVL